MSIFGTQVPKFNYSGSEVILSHSIIEPNFIISDDVENKSVLTGHKDFIYLGNYSSFDVTLNLYKYSSPSSTFQSLYGYKNKNVYFWPHSDGRAISGSNGKGMPFNITDMNLYYLTDTNFAELLKIHFEATGYTNITGSLI